MEVLASVTERITNFTIISQLLDTRSIDLVLLAARTEIILMLGSQIVLPRCDTHINAICSVCFMNKRGSSFVGAYQKADYLAIFLMMDVSILPSNGKYVQVQNRWNLTQCDS